MFSIVFCLLLSCFTFHLGFVHPLQDVALHQCLALSSVCCFPVSFLPMPSCHLLFGCSLDLFPLLGRHSVQRLSTYCPSFLLYLHFCFSVYSIISIVSVLFLISEYGIVFLPTSTRTKEVRCNYVSMDYCKNHITKTGTSDSVQAQDRPQPPQPSPVFQTPHRPYRAVPLRYWQSDNRTSTAVLPPLRATQKGNLARPPSRSLQAVR